MLLVALGAICRCSHAPNWRQNLLATWTELPPNRVDAMSEERLQMCQDVLVTKPFQVQGTLQKEGTKESKDPALNLL